jgi:hypothetical protein
MKIRIWHIVVFVLLLAAFAIASMPAAFVASRLEGLVFQRASGSVWNGRLEGVQARDFEIDSVQWRISPFDLIQGKVIAPVQLAGDIEGEVRLLANAKDRRIMADQLRIEGLPLDNLHLVGVTQIEGLDLFFDDGVCRTAEARVTSDVLERSSQALGIHGPPLSGEARCDGDDALIVLGGGTPPGDRVDVVIRLRGDGSGEWRLAIASQTSEVQAALSVAGFRYDANAAALVRVEELVWFPS